MILRVLQEWEIHPSSVAGHSSGEIAASVAAGHLSEEEAIKVAYYRGKAAVDLQQDNSPRLGMLAVGLAQDHPAVQDLLQTASDSISLACVNSPESVTLSGYASAIEDAHTALQGGGHFSRVLQVDLAYHSAFVAHISVHYKDLLEQNVSSSVISKHRQAKMFSSVTGVEKKTPCDAEYWKTNMESRVLFEQAVKSMLIDDEPADCLIEIGPSGVLSGPINQIKKSLAGKGSAVEYHTAYKRGPDATSAMFDVAGQLFLSGGRVNIEQANAHSQGRQPHINPPSMIMDLPNYAWNHSTKYWYESRSSKDWRFRRYPHHDLLGAKVLGTSWSAPSWKKVLRPQEVSWLQDHQIGGTVIFPAAGYIAMAVEAMYQAGQSRGLVDGALEVHEIAYRLRNVRFNRAMVLDGSDQGILFSMSHQHNGNDAWNRFSIVTFDEDEAPTEHCSGLIILENERAECTVP